MDNEKKSSYIKEDKDKIVSIVGRTKAAIYSSGIKLSADKITTGQLNFI
jgi:hypothetical protein